MLDIESSALIDLLVNERASVHPQLREQLHDVVEEVERSGKPLMEVIENYGLFTKQEMLQMMADNLGSYVWTPKNSPDIEESVIKMVENNTARSCPTISDIRLIFTPFCVTLRLLLRESSISMRCARKESRNATPIRALFWSKRMKSASCAPRYDFPIAAK